MLPTDKYYYDKFKKVVNVLTHQGLNISKVAKAGSRSRQQQTKKSDMDVIISVSGDPSRKEFYPKLIKVLKNNFPIDNIYVGSNYNVIHLNFQSGGKFDFVLLTINKFDKEYGNNLEFRKKNL